MTKQLRQRARRHLRILKAIERNPARRGRCLHIPQAPLQTYDFSPNASEGQRDMVVIALRKDGFSASRDAQTLTTNASRAQIALSSGAGWFISRADAIRHNPARRGRRPHIPQAEFGYTAGAFNLAGETGSDGDRLARERDERERARAHAAKGQTDMFKNPKRRKMKQRSRKAPKKKSKSKSRRVVLRTIIRREVIAKNPRRRKRRRHSRLRAFAVKKSVRRRRSIRSIRRNPRRRKLGTRNSKLGTGRRGRVILLVIRPNKYVHTFAQPTRDAVAGELRKEWGRSAPQFVSAVCRQLSEHRGYEWTKRIMGNVVHFTKL